MKKLINEQRLPLLGAVVGLLAGYLYYKLVGCSSGTCAITSNPINSSLYGAMMGTLFFSLFKKEKRVSK
jgi:LytS/YehU family sensor histidine kinase